MQKSHLSRISFLNDLHFKSHGFNIQTVCVFSVWHVNGVHFPWVPSYVTRCCRRGELAVPAPALPLHRGSGASPVPELLSVPAAPAPLPLLCPWRWRLAADTWYVTVTSHSWLVPSHTENVVLDFWDAYGPYPGICNYSVSGYSAVPT